MQKYVKRALCDFTFLKIISHRIVSAHFLMITQINNYKTNETMSKHIFLTLALSAFLLTANAQNDNRGHRPGQGMKSEKQVLTPEQRAERSASRIANELMLDDAGAAKFKSIYQDYQKELGEVNKKYMPERPKMQDGVKPEKKERTDKDIEDGIKNRFAHQRALLEVEEKYYSKFRSVLTPRQIEKVYKMAGKGHKGFGGRGSRGGRGGFGHGPQGRPGFGQFGQGGPRRGPQGWGGRAPQNRGGQGGQNTPTNNATE